MKKSKIHIFPSFHNLKSVSTNLLCLINEGNHKIDLFTNVSQIYGVFFPLRTWAPLHKTIVSLQLMVSLQTMVSTIDFLILIGYGAVLLYNGSYHSLQRYH